MTLVTSESFLLLNDPNGVSPTWNLKPLYWYYRYDMMSATVSTSTNGWVACLWKCQPTFRDKTRRHIFLTHIQNMKRLGLIFKLKILIYLNLAQETRTQARRKKDWGLRKSILCQKCSSFVAEKLYMSGKMLGPCNDFLNGKLQLYLISGRGKSRCRY